MWWLLRTYCIQEKAVDELFSFSFVSLKVLTLVMKNIRYCRPKESTDLTYSEYEKVMVQYEILLIMLIVKQCFNRD